LLTGGFIGVDVFYVLSGYFITGILVRDFEKHGRIRFAEFYARRARRLIPVAALVIFVTAIFSWYVMPGARFRDLGTEFLYSSLYLSNFRFAGQATNYFANQDPSPVLHYWSLAVEEQFYFFWPLFILLVGILARKFGKKLLVPGIALVCAISLFYCIKLTTTDQPMAFYMFPMRAWELGIGALAYIWSAKKIFQKPAISALLGWLGLLIIVTCAFTFTEKMAFPGWLAFIPVLGCFLMAVTQQVKHGPALLLSRAPMVKLGNWSYSLYLWHWPVLVLGVIWLGHSLSLAGSVAAVAISILLAWASYTFWENPIRNSNTLSISRISTSLVTFIFIASSLGASFSVLHQGNYLIQNLATYSIKAIQNPVELERKLQAAAKMNLIPANLTPALETANLDYPRSRDCHLDFETTDLPTDCVFGDKNGNQTVLLTGDSHAHQWFPAIAAIALRQRWKLYFYSKSACPLTYGQVANPHIASQKYPECRVFQKNILSAFKKMKPDILIVGAARGIVQFDVPNYARFITNFKSAPHLLLLGDNPYVPTLEYNIQTCLDKHRKDVKFCNLKAEDATRPLFNGQLEEIANLNGGQAIQVEQWFCTKKVCPPIIGNVNLYRLESHITATSAKFFEPFLEKALLDALKKPKPKN